MSLSGPREGWWQASDGRWYPPTSQPAVAPSPAAPPPPAPSLVNKTPGVILLVSGGLAILGSFLPWISLTAPFVGTITRSGLDGGGDGLLTAGLGAALGVLGLVQLQREASRSTLIAGILLCLALGALTAFEFSDASSRFATANASSDLIVTSYGSGLYVLAVAAVVGIVGVVQASGSRTSPPRAN
jgi:hypothetical protein